MLAVASVALYSDPTGGEAPLLEELAGIAGLLAPDYRHDASTGRYTEAGFAHTLSAMAPQLFVNSLPALYARSPPFTIHPRHKTLALQPLRYLPASPPPPAASAAGQLLAAHPVAASASALGALLAIGAACSYVALSRRLAKLSELDEAAEALDPEYF